MIKYKTYTFSVMEQVYPCLYFSAEKILLIIKKIRSFPVFLSLSIKGRDEGNPGADDAVLIKGFLNGNERDFNALVARYRNMIFNLCLNITSDYDEALDCSQEVFIKMYKNLHRFEFRSSLSTWLYAIAANTCRSRLMSSVRKQTVSMACFENIPVTGKDIDPCFLLERSEGETAVRRAIAELPHDERILIVMRDLEDRSYEEIAEITGTRTGTVKSRLSRARHRLRGMLEGVL
jgi:RNA polymerase sigma-70 factor, ECF subfamily